MSDLSDLLERFRRGAEVLAVTLTGAAGEEVDYITAPGKWSIRQILRHVADSEIVGAQRFRHILAEENPTLIGYDQDAWVRNLDYHQRKPAQSLETFRRMRADNHELLKDLPESAFERTGNHSQRGRLSLRQLVETYADHAESHGRQLQSIREEWKKLKGKK